MSVRAVVMVSVVGGVLSGLACLGLAPGAAAESYDPLPTCMQVRDTPNGNGDTVLNVANECPHSVRILWRTCPLAVGDAMEIIRLAPGEHHDFLYRAGCEYILKKASW